MADALLEAVRGLWLPLPDIVPKRLLAKLREQQPGLGAGNKEVREALAVLKAESRAARLDALPDEIQQLVFGQLCNALDPRPAVDYSSASIGLREPMQRVGEGTGKSPLEQLKEEHAAAAALGLKAEVRSCRALREATGVEWFAKGLSTTDLATLGKLIPVLPALETLRLIERSASPGPDGGQLVEGLGVGALPAVTHFALGNVCVGDAGASALAAALDRGALPRLKELGLCGAAIGDAGLVALAPALRRRPALETLELAGNPFGDEGLAALVAPPPADAPPPQAEALAQLKWLILDRSQITDAGCARLASRLRSGALPALEELCLAGIPASDPARAAVHEARFGLQGWR